MTPNHTAKQSALSGMESFTPQFGGGFLQDHAGRILSDPKIALVELIANCWDAGADTVSITWPKTYDLPMEISDNGSGMTYDEFRHRWLHLNYNRQEYQGDDVEFPKGNQKSNRKAFGRNGKGRHAMFCFSASYRVETWKNGVRNIFEVRRASDESAPFHVHQVNQSPDAPDEHGTILRANVNLNLLLLAEIIELIGSKFISDPSFRVLVNNELVELTDIESITKVYEISVQDLGKVLIRHIYSDAGGRTSKQHGVAWWVQKRLVGEPSWRGFDDIPYLDARRAQSRHHTFIVEADMLVNSVKTDWSDFFETKEFYAVQGAVKEFISAELSKLMQDVYKERKEIAITAHIEELKELPPSSRYMVGTFLDEIQKNLPTIGEKELSAAVNVLSKLEKSRSGYILLEQLARLSPDDLDGLSQLLSTWTVQEANIVR